MARRRCIGMSMDSPQLLAVELPPKLSALGLFRFRHPPISRAFPQTLHTTIASVRKMLMGRQTGLFAVSPPIPPLRLQAPRPQFPLTLQPISRERPQI